MTLRTSDSLQDIDLAAVSSMFGRVENAMKTVQQVCGEFPAPPLNEIRMAFYHVLKTADAVNVTDHLQSAFKHCQRAYYDAREIEVLAELEIIKDFEKACSGHEDIIKANIQDYVDKRKAVLQARGAINEADLNHETRDEQFDKYDKPCETLRQYCEEITAVQPAISTAIWKYKVILSFKFIGALAAILAIIGFILRLFF